jgi:outer membrane protein
MRAKKLDRMKPRPYHIVFGSLVRGTTQMRYVFYSLAALPVGALTFSAGASDLAVPPAQIAPSDWIITLGADARAVPRYMGSNQWVMVPVPYLDRHRPGTPERFHSPRDGTGVALFDNGVLAMGPVGSLIWQRRQAANPFLNGLGNVGYTLQVGGFVDYWAVEWLRARVEGLQGFGAANGVTANFAVDAVVPLSPALTLSGGPRARVVTSGAESPYFSITQAQSMASGLPAYNAGGGWQAVGAGTQVKYRFNPTWATYGLIEYDKLVGATAASPIVAGPGGSTSQWTFGVGFTYSFAMSGLPF